MKKIKKSKMIIIAISAYISLWLVFGLLYLHLATVSEGEAFLMQEDLLLKIKIDEFSNDVGVDLEYELAKKLFQEFDEDINFITDHTKGIPIYLNSYADPNILVKPIGTGWADYYIRKFIQSGYDSATVVSLNEKEFYGSTEYEYLLLTIHDRDNKITKEFILLINTQYLDDIVDIEKRSLRNFESLSLITLKGFLALPVNFLDEDFKKVYEYEKNKSFKYPIIDFLYFSAVTITTLGYGDIYPNSSLVRSLVMIETLIGMVLLAMFISLLFDWLNNLEKR